MKKEKPKKRVSNIMLTIIVIMIITFTAACFALTYLTDNSISDTLITAWFAFWGTEIVALTAIKTMKVKHSKEVTIEEENLYEEEEIE